jgi:hypothetical protein
LLQDQPLTNLVCKDCILLTLLLALVLVLVLATVATFMTTISALYVMCPCSCFTITLPSNANPYALFSLPYTLAFDRIFANSSFLDTLLQLHVFLLISSKLSVLPLISLHENMVSQCLPSQMIDVFSRLQALHPKPCHAHPLLSVMTRAVHLAHTLRLSAW